MTIEDGIPVLETERLILRGWRADDFVPLRDMKKSPEMMRFITGEPMSEEDSWTKFLRAVGHWKIMGFGYWVVEERESGRTIGEVGFGDFKRSIEPSLKGEPEIGWLLDVAVQGKGYASEAALAAVKWGDENFSGKRMSCIVDPDHVASIRIAKKCGFQKTGVTVYHDSNVVMLHRDAG